MLQSRWSSKGVEAPLVGRINLIGWADNLIMVSRSAQEAQDMLDEYTSVLHSFGMEWKASSVEVVCVGLHRRLADDELKWRDTSGSAHPTPRVDSITLLGGLVSTDHLAPIEYRLAQASRKFWKHSSFFLARRIPWSTRLKELAKRVYPVATYGAATTLAEAVGHRTLRAHGRACLCSRGAPTEPGWRYLEADPRVLGHELAAACEPPQTLATRNGQESEAHRAVSDPPRTCQR